MNIKPFNQLISELLHACWTILDDNEDKSVDAVAADCDALFAATKAFSDAFYGDDDEPEAPPLPA